MATAAKGASPPLLTYEQYMAEFLTEPPTMQPYEIIEGIRHFMNTPNWRHQRIVLNIAEALHRYEEESGKGVVGLLPFDVIIRRVPRLQTRQPDVFFVSHERLEQGGGVPAAGPLEVGPELVVEVLSPSETPCSLQGKLEDYRSIGVQECWIVSPDAETVQVLRLAPEKIETVATYAYDHTLHSAIFPDLLSLPLPRFSPPEGEPGNAYL